MPPRSFEIMARGDVCGGGKPLSDYYGKSRLARGRAVTPASIDAEAAGHAKHAASRYAVKRAEIRTEGVEADAARAPFAFRSSRRSVSLF